MLRVTPLPDEQPGLNLKLEGKLIGLWVDEFRSFCASCEPQSHPLRLDLADVTFVDANGIHCLQDLLRQGAQIYRCSGFVAEIIELASKEAS
ncbi:MAG: STAS domain-containing protein [Pirellulales bacterium]|nr:STAS domain-containing protein [Pirellulales bacterium]